MSTGDRMNLEKYLITEVSATEKTKLQECLFCVGFSIRQSKGKLTLQMLHDPVIFHDAFSDIYIDSTEDALSIFRDQFPDYVSSVLLSVNALFNSGFIGKNYYIYRGKGFMDEVYKVYQSAHKTFKKGPSNGDKWNPGDVWIAKKGIKTPLQNEDMSKITSMPAFNAIIAKNLRNGQYMGISLKKTKNANVHHIIPTEPHVPITFSHIEKPKGGAMMWRTGVNIITNKVTIDLRSFDRAGGGDVTGEILIKGTSARHGKVPSNVFKDTIGSPNNIPQKSSGDIKRLSETPEGVEELKRMILRLWIDATGEVYSDVDSKFWNMRLNDKNKTYERNPFGYFQSIIHALEFAVWLKNSGDADKVVDNWYLQASSLNEFSSEHLKIY